jgi:predicted RNase H-like HicB family nuclease
MQRIVEISQFVKYGLLKRPYSLEGKLPQTINFDSHYDAENEIHWLECSEFPEFYVTGKDKEELARNVTDTMLVYFDVPTYLAKRYKPTNMRFTFQNQKTGEQEYVSLDYIDELRKAAV